MVSTLSYYQTYIESNNNTTHNTIPIPNENNCSKSPIHQNNTQSTYCPLNQVYIFSFKLNTVSYKLNINLVSNWNLSKMLFKILCKFMYNSACKIPLVSNWNYVNSCTIWAWKIESVGKLNYLSILVWTVCNILLFRDLNFHAWRM